MKNQTPVCLVQVAGTLDVTTAPEVRTALVKCLGNQPDAIVLDLSAMRIADDIALSVFPAMARHSSGWPGTTLVLAAASPELQRALDRMAVCRYVPSYPTVEQAVADQRPATPAARFHQWLEPVPSSLAMARALVDRACRSWDVRELSEPAQLVVTELVANGVRHARTEMHLSLAKRRRYLHLAVHDRSRTPARLVGALDEYADSGRGLIVVDAIASSWGCSPTADGKAVWATLRLPVSPVA